MSKSFIVHSALVAALLTSAAYAQNPSAPPSGGPPPPPPPVAGAPPAPPAGAVPGRVQPATAAPISESGLIRYIIYGPQGEVQALVLRGDKIVNVPPQLGAQTQINLTQGTSVTITGVPQYFGRQRQVFAQSMQVNGRNFASPAGPAPNQPPPASPVPPPPPDRAQPVPPPPPPQ